jgi:hypothetical protein
MIPCFQEYLHAHIHEQRWSHEVQYPHISSRVISPKILLSQIYHVMNVMSVYLMTIPNVQIRNTADNVEYYNDKLSLPFFEQVHI